MIRDRWTAVDRYLTDVLVPFDASNVVREGAVADAASPDPSVQGVRRFIELLATEPRVSATALQTVGTKGYDGFAIALVTVNG